MGLGAAFGFGRSSGGSTAGSTFEVILDSSLSGFAMTDYHGGMSIPGAWRAANLLADMIGALPWYAERVRGDKPVERLSPTPALLEQPCPPDTRMTTFSSWALDLIWHGNAIGVIASRDQNGYPTAVFPVPAQWCGVARKLGPDYALTQFPIRGPIVYSIGGEEYSPADVIHIKGPCAPGMLRGFGVIQAHLFKTLRLAHAELDQALALSEHGVPTGLLKATNPDTTPDELIEAKSKWLENQERRTIQALGPSVDFTPLAWKPDEMEMVESRKWTLVDVANIFGLPPSMLGAAQNSMTYSNVEQEGLNLIRYSLNGHLGRFEQTLSLAQPRGTAVKADLDSLLRADTLARYQAHQIAIVNQFKSRDEVRDEEGMPPLTAEQKKEFAELAAPAPKPLPRLDSAMPHALDTTGTQTPGVPPGAPPQLTAVPTSPERKTS